MAFPLLDEKTRAVEALAHKDAISDLLETGLSDDNIKVIHGVTKVDFTAKDDAKLPVAHLVAYGKAPSVVLLKGVRHMLRWLRKARSVAQGVKPHRHFWFIVLVWRKIELVTTGSGIMYWITALIE